MPQKKGNIPYNTGKRICDNCRKYYEKSQLKISSKGQFCRDCYPLRHGSKSNGA